MGDIAILPLALTVMLGPQILVSMLLITRKDVVKSSLVYTFSITITLLTTIFLYNFLSNSIDLHRTTVGNRPVLKYLLICLFIILIVKNIINRKKITEPPKWMQGIKTASLSKIFFIGFCLIAFMPTDIIVAFTVGSLVDSAEKSILLEIMPFLSTVLFICLLPLIVYFSLGKNGDSYIEKANNWLNTHGYVINIIVFLFFIYLLL